MPVAPSRQDHAIAVASSWQPACPTICALSSACLYLAAYPALSCFCSRLDNGLRAYPAPAQIATD